MRLTTKGRYAVTAIMDLAIHQKAKPVILSDIAARQSISQVYLGRLFARLTHSGLVESRRGPSGGYTLARKPEDISLADILDAVEEDIYMMRCGGQTNCQQTKECLSHGVWETLGQRIRGVLVEISVADIIKGSSVDTVIRRQTADWEMLKRNDDKVAYIS